MTSYELDAEEQEILEAFEQGHLPSIPNADEKIKAARQMAKNTLHEKGSHVIVLDDDVAEVFHDAKSVNDILRAVANVMKQRDSSLAHIK
ncbi:MAG: hypothetical protein HQM12_13185 [SAR324 cluster bacterium]|nr:hypothetical protein [SAR324 cluster bacterium]